MSTHAASILRTWAITLGGIACLVYAFIPPTNPVWIGMAGTVWGIEPLIRSRGTPAENARQEAAE